MFEECISYHFPTFVSTIVWLVAVRAKIGILRKKWKHKSRQCASGIHRLCLSSGPATTRRCHLMQNHTTTLPLATLLVLRSWVSCILLPAKLMAYQYILPVATVSACLHIMHNFHVSIHIKRLNGLCCECWNGQSQWGSTFGLTLFQDWEWAQVYELSENALCATKSYRLVAASAAMQTTLHWSSEALPTDMLIAGGRW